MKKQILNRSCQGVGSGSLLHNGQHLVGYKRRENKFTKYTKRKQFYTFDIPDIVGKFCIACIQCGQHWLCFHHSCIPRWIQMSGKQKYKITYNLLKTCYFTVKLFFALVILIVLALEMDFLVSLFLSILQFPSARARRIRNYKIDKNRDTKKFISGAKKNKKCENICNFNAK